MIAGMTEAEIQLSTARSVSKTEFASPFRTTFLKTMVRCVACFGSILLVGSIYAQSLIVAVSSGQFTTYVEASDGSGTIVSRTTPSASPISDEIDLPIPWAGPTATNHAIASANLFVVSDQTGWGGANAEAVSQLRFSPLADQTQTLDIGIGITGSPDAGTCSAAQVILMDLTANSEVWDYIGNVYPFTSPYPAEIPTGNNIPWNLEYNAADFTIDTSFLASHQYELTMIAASDAGSDDESVQIRLSGLVAVPEPSTTLFLAMCGASFIISRRQRR
jgi:hypothetical protein